MKKTQRLDTILIRRGWVTEEQILQGLQQQQHRAQRWGSTLVELGIITEVQLVEALSEQYGTPPWDPSEEEPQPEATRLFRERWVRKRGFVPLRFNPSTRELRIAMSDPHNSVLADEIRFHASAKSLQILVAPQITLSRFWDKTYRNGSETIQPQEPVERDLGVVERTHDSARAKRGVGATPVPVDSTEHRSATRVLLWHTKPAVAEAIKALLELERCQVSFCSPPTIPPEESDYVVFDEPNATAHPEYLRRLKEEMPQLQLIPCPSWTETLLRSPLSYESMRDGYLQLAGQVRRWLTPDLVRSDVARYVYGMARFLPITNFEADTVIAASELIPLVSGRATTSPEREALISQIGCPYPVGELLRASLVPFNQTGLKPGQLSQETPLAARVLSVVTEFLNERVVHPIATIEEAGQFSEMLRRDAGTKYDPVAVEALLRVVREEILEDYLPPGPPEVMLVADHPLELDHLSELLEREGWRVVTADIASDARSLIERRSPDAVVWAAAGAMDWLRWQQRTAPGIVSFLMLDKFDSALARTALEAGYEDVWSGDWDAGIAAAKLRRAVERRPHSSPESQLVTGTLSHFSFIDMVQILSAGMRSVRIELNKGRETGTVILWQGRIKYAEASGKFGEEAVYEILRWREAIFTLSPAETPPETNCRMPNEAILLDGCRLLDEQERNANSCPPGVTVSELSDA